MDMTKNIIPESVRTIHMIAICGTGMGALACMLRDLGYEVTGSDQNVYPPMSTFLEERDIFVQEGFDGDHLAYGPDLVIVGNAISRDNPEVIKLIEKGLFYCSMPQALNRFVVNGKKTILVTGTHGKTTTSSIIAWILEFAGFEPSFVIGGILKNFNSNYRLGNGEYVVLEGDEYDTAFFDKGPKFLHYDPEWTVLTSVEFDHADIFKDLDHVRRAFGTLLSGLAEQSTLVAKDLDSNIAGLFEHARCRIETYGLDQHSFWRLGEAAVHDGWSRFDIMKTDRLMGQFKSRIMGEHNLMNMLAAVAVADGLNIQKQVVAKALESFENPRRRQEIRGVKNGITVMDDFAHHPTAVRETIRAVKPFFTKGKIVAVFEPRTNSSMRNIFQDDYPGSFDHADLVCIREPSRLDKIPGDIRFSSKKLVGDLARNGKAAHFFSDTGSIIDFLLTALRPGDLVLIMSNGGFDNIHERLLEAL